jgi:hypothetical protein
VFIVILARGKDVKSDSGCQAPSKDKTNNLSVWKVPLYRYQVPPKDKTAVFVRVETTNVAISSINLWGNRMSDTDKRQIVKFVCIEKTVCTFEEKMQWDTVVTVPIWV